jgi:hypothetical protein
MSQDFDYDDYEDAGAADERVGIYVAVSTEQFEFGEDEVTHIPTGARFVAYPEIADPHIVNWGKAGDILDNGEEYERGEIMAMALDILRRRLQTEV